VKEYLRQLLPHELGLSPHPSQILSIRVETGWEGPLMTAGNWRGELRQRIEALDWEHARADVRPFLERERDIALVTAESLGSLLAPTAAPESRLTDFGKTC